MSTATGMLETSKFYLSLLNSDLARGYVTLPRTQARGEVDSLARAMDWICRAQDAFDCGGVARSYSLVYSPFFRRKGWIAPYPETTGYIIPTMLDYAEESGREEFVARALRMADWESEIQMASGAVQGGTIDQPPTPAVFNTGQVIFGWVRAFRQTNDERYLRSARRAGDFLLGVQDADGAWRKSLSAYASGGMASYTYNTRTAWALLELAEVSQEERYRDGALRNIEFAITQQLPNGWLKSNCLHDPSRPLVHTIAYSLRGILEVGIALKNDAFIGAARTGADALLARQREDGSLSGRYDEQWRPAVTWSCLTGNAQMGLVWGRLYQVTGEEKYLTGLRRANAFTRAVQWLGTGNPGLDGGIGGSFPLHGRYGRFEVLNWAVKFFADALMLESALVAAPGGAAVRPTGVLR